MKRLVALLSATTLAFAASTFYCAHLLQQERARHALAAIGSQPQIVPSNLLLRSNPIEPGAPTKPGGNDNASSGPRRDPARLAIARRNLDELRDPSARAEHAKTVESLLRENWQSIARDIGMSSAELDRMMTELTEQSLKAQQRRLECELDPACDSEALKTAPGMSQDDRIAAALGPARYASYKAYQETSAERSIVFSLNAQLPAADALSEATTSKLVQVLGEQRRQFARDAAQRGEKVADYDGIIRSAATDGAADEYARRRESANEYSRHEVELVSGILTARQLARFRDMIEGSRLYFDGHLREAEIAQSADTTAGSQP